MKTTFFGSTNIARLSLFVLVTAWNFKPWSLESEIQIQRKWIIFHILTNWFIGRQQLFSRYTYPPFTSLYLWKKPLSDDLPFRAKRKASTTVDETGRCYPWHILKPLIRGTKATFFYRLKVFIGPKLTQVSRGNFHRKAPKWVKIRVTSGRP